MLTANTAVCNMAAWLLCVCECDGGQIDGRWKDRSSESGEVED